MIRLEEGEKVLQEVRRHWFIFWTEGFILSFLAVVPLVIILVIGMFWPSFITSKAFFLAGFFYCLYLYILWLFFFLAWTDYYLDVWVITNKKIFHIEQRALFKRQISQFRLERVQDITVEIPGFFATILNFGDIHVQTAGQGREFIIKTARQPYEVKKIISDTLSEIYNKKNSGL